MALLASSRPRIAGLNESEILIAVENILASIQPANAPRLTTAGASVNYSTAVRAIRRARAVPASVSEDELPWIGVRRLSIGFEPFPSQRRLATMRVELTLRVRGQDEYDADNVLAMLEDDITAAMYSGLAMNPDNVGAAQSGYASDLWLREIQDELDVGDVTRAGSRMVFEIKYLRGNGKEVGHTGLNP